MTDTRGRFLWYELTTTDPDAAIAFYRSLVGWGTQTFEHPDMQYTMFTANDVPLAGVWKLTPEATGGAPNWVAYVGTDDLDGTVRRARELGATVLADDQEIEGVGKFAMLADPQGAAFALYQPANDPGEETDPAPMEFSWHELMTSDHPAALRFYADLFGWKKLSELDMGPMGMYVLFGRGERTYGGMFNTPPEMTAPPHWLLYVRVTALDAAVKRVRDGGGQVLNGPMDVPGGDRIAQCMDPQGAAFALHEKRG